jgi:hemerythrin-like metal-binding protein
MPDDTLSQEDLLGDPQLDGDHQEMLTLVHAVAKAAPEAARVPLAALEALSRRHFEAEEERMAEAGYYGVAAHRAEHRLLLEQLDALRAGGSIADPAAAGTLLSAMLLRHIREVDRLFARFLGRRS